MNMIRAVIIAAFAVIPVAAQADARQDLVDGMAKCAAIADNPARLACYDALTPSVKAAQTEPSTPVASVAPATPPAATTDNRPWYDPSRVFGIEPQHQTTPDQFGGENLATPPPPPGQVAVAEPPALDSITVGVSDYSFNRFDKFLVVLDNGQIWQQLEADSGKARFDRNGKNTVTITRGFMGSYNLVVNDASLLFKVRRLK